jgi:hypothetical protein
MKPHEIIQTYRDRYQDADGEGGQGEPVTRATVPSSARTLRWRSSSRGPLRDSTAFGWQSIFRAARSTR